MVCSASKGHRLKFFAETFRERLEVVDQGFTPTQQAAMDELQRQAGYKRAAVKQIIFLKK